MLRDYVSWPNHDIILQSARGLLPEVLSANLRANPLYTWCFENKGILSTKGKLIPSVDINLLKNIRFLQL